MTPLLELFLLLPEADYIPLYVCIKTTSRNNNYVCLPLSEKKSKTTPVKEEKQGRNNLPSFIESDLGELSPRKSSSALFTAQISPRETRESWFYEEKSVNLRFFTVGAKGDWLSSTQGKYESERPVETRRDVRRTTTTF